MLAGLGDTAVHSIPVAVRKPERAKAFLLLRTNVDLRPVDRFQMVLVLQQVAAELCHGHRRVRDARGRVLAGEDVVVLARHFKLCEVNVVFEVFDVFPFARTAQNDKTQ